MVLSLQQIFGTNAVQVGDEITIKTGDFASTGLDGSNPSPSQVFAGILKRATTTLNTDPILNDPTNGVTASSFQQPKNFVIRGTESQIAYPIALTVYTTDITGGTDFDPDNVKP